jgi:hypothetical protein
MSSMRAARRAPPYTIRSLRAGAAFSLYSSLGLVWLTKPAHSAKVRPASSVVELTRVDQGLGHLEGLVSPGLELARVQLGSVKRVCLCELVGLAGVESPVRVVKRLNIHLQSEDILGQAKRVWPSKKWHLCVSNPQDCGGQSGDLRGFHSRCSCR